MKREACMTMEGMDTIYMPRALGFREHYRLSSINFAIRRMIYADSSTISVFRMDTSVVTEIVYCISNNRGLSPMHSQEGIGRHDGEIKFHQDKPEGDMLGWPQSYALSGLASHSVHRSGNA